MSKRLTIQELISRAQEVHGDKYDYSLVENEGLFVKNKIICKKCGNVFEMSFNNHVNQKQGCKLCSHRSYSYSTDEWVSKAKEIHRDKYDYSKVAYKNKNTKVCIICQEHGEFWMTPDKHVNSKQGCPKCAKNHKLDTDSFINKARLVHGNYYDYSKSVYKDTETKVCIICPIHGEFWQTPHGHLCGQGCPKCNEEKNVNEIKLLNYITNNINHKVISQYKCDWLGEQSIDIFIPDINVGIEYQGIQHFKPVKYFGGIKKYEYMVSKDKEKFEKCKKNGIKLFYFSSERHLPNDYIDYIYSNNNKLLEEIKKYDTYG